MNRRVTGAALGFAALTAAAVGLQVASKPAAASDRDLATRRGVSFIYSVARNPATFNEWGYDLLMCFAYVATTSGDPQLAGMAARMGRERAQEWRRLHRRVPQQAGAEEIGDWIWGSMAATTLGAPDPRLDDELRRAAGRFSTRDYLHFDPFQEAPPSYAVFQDALVNSYAGDEFGITLGAPYKQLLGWLPSMRPYPPRIGSQAWYDAVYSITHLVYTYNHYNQNRIARECFPGEVAYLEAALPEAMREGDSEIVGECLDSLQAFGLTDADPLIRTGIAYLLKAQNRDGSWGDPHDKDIYNRYHAAWTGIGGLQSFRWTRVLGCAQSQQ